MIFSLDRPVSKYQSNQSTFLVAISIWKKKPHLFLIWNGNKKLWVTLLSIEYLVFSHLQPNEKNINSKKILEYMNFSII